MNGNLKDYLAFLIHWRFLPFTKENISSVLETEWFWKWFYM